MTWTLYAKSQPRMEHMNEGQHAAFESVQKGKSVFITGPGGTGKSFLMKQIFEEIPRRTGRTVALTALTGCAAILLHPKAKTLHSWAGVGLARDTVPILVKNIKKNRRAALRWLSTDILVIDEISMMTPEFFETLDEVGRKIRRNEVLPFGGIQLVLVGDFFQLPPVCKDEEETRFLFESELWKKIGLVKHELTQIVRQKDEVFQKVLNEARVGKLTKKSVRILNSRVGVDYSKQTIRPTMLFTRRAEVDDINYNHLKKLEGARHTYKATTVYSPTAQNLSSSESDPLVQKAIAKMDMNAPYSPELTLVVGAQVMLVTNLDQEAGLVNGSRGVVVRFGKSGDEVSDLVPIVKFRNDLEIPIEHATWEIADFQGVCRKQIPLRLAWAVTIHKAQGATLDCALVDVGNRTFEYGQAYVALSRVKDLESLYIHDFDSSAFKAHDKVLAFYEASSKD